MFYLFDQEDVYRRHMDAVVKEAMDAAEKKAEAERKLNEEERKRNVAIIESQNARIAAMAAELAEYRADAHI